MALPTLNDEQRLYLQTIFDYFHEQGKWPTYRYVDRKLRRVLDIEKIAKSLPSGFASTSAFNLRLDDDAILSISAIYLCSGSEEELADFVETLIFCVKRYFSTEEDTVQISSDDLRQHLGMSESSVRKVGLLIEKEYDYYIYDQFGCKDNECNSWVLTLSRRIRELDGVQSIEQYLEKLDQIKKTPATPSSKDTKNNKIFPLNSTIILSFVLLAIGFTAISGGNFLFDHNPIGFFGIFSESGLVTYYIIENALFPLGFLLIGIAVFLLISTIIRNIADSVRPPQEDINALRERVEKEPDKVEPIWDLGRGNLQQYFNRNLRQISNIYWFSVGVMIVGFVLITVGIIESFILGANGNVAITPALIGSLAGVITEFIGATFLFIYRSTVQQATNYMKTLERINSVGMATKILDTISNESQELRDATKADIVKLLLSQNLEQKDDAKNQ